MDGWTGKGAISSQLEASFRLYSENAPKLVVIADPCGRAWLAASGEDWLIPSGILGSTVSGLISRTILNEEIKLSGSFHGCKHWNHLTEHDISRSFVDEVWFYVANALRNETAATWSRSDREYHFENQNRQFPSSKNVIAWKI